LGFDTQLSGSSRICSFPTVACIGIPRNSLRMVAILTASVFPPDPGLMFICPPDTRFNATAGISTLYFRRITAANSSNGITLTGGGEKDLQIVRFYGSANLFRSAASGTCRIAQRSVKKTDNAKIAQIPAPSAAIKSGWSLPPAMTIPTIKAVRTTAR
jgi:hypothetical protein